MAYAFTDAVFPNLKTAELKTDEMATVSGDALFVLYPDDQTFHFLPENTDPRLREVLKRDGPPFPGPASSFVVVSYATIAERVDAKLAERGK
jgi:hypothetical protein